MAVIKLIKQTRLVIGAIVFISITSLYYLYDARTSSIFPPCPFHYLTGLFCPGCGSQRALSSLLKGDVLQAAGFNILFVLGIPLLLYAAVDAVMPSARLGSSKLFYSPLFVRIVLLVVVVFWILRNIPLYPFSLLAPHTV